MMRQLPFIVLAASLVLAVVACLVTASSVASSNQDAKDAIAERKLKESDRNAVRDDVRGQEKYLRDFKASLGLSAIPVRGIVEAPLGMSENLLTGEFMVGDFHDLFVDEGIVLTGVSAEEVKQIANRPAGTLPPKPQAPSRIKAGYRLIKVTIRVTNRSGMATDPGCGMDGDFGSYVYDDAGSRGGYLRPSYDNVGTYLTSCNDGLADGASGNVVLGVGVSDKHKLKALSFRFLNDNDAWDDKGELGTTKVLVFDEPV